MPILLLFFAVVFLLDIIYTKMIYGVFFPGELVTVILLFLFGGCLAGFSPFVWFMGVHVLGLSVFSWLIIAIIVIWVIAAILDLRDHDHITPFV